MVEVDQGISGPQLLLQFLASDNLTGPLQQYGEDFKGLIPKLDANSVLAQFARTAVDYEVAEASLVQASAAVANAHFAQLSSGVYHRNVAAVERRKCINSLFS